MLQGEAKYAAAEQGSGARSQIDYIALQHLALEAHIWLIYMQFNGSA
jgi:hypothetical protein